MAKTQTKINPLIVVVIIIAIFFFMGKGVDKQAVAENLVKFRTSSLTYDGPIAVNAVCNGGDLTQYSKGATTFLPGGTTCSKQYGAPIFDDTLIGIVRSGCQTPAKLYVENERFNRLVACCEKDGTGTGIIYSPTSTPESPTSLDSSREIRCTQCIPQCTNKVCGDDGCGGSCGTCGTGFSCSANQCVATCVPKTSCSAGVSCGQESDGCGGLVNCGTCAVGKSCTQGQCVTNVGQASFRTSALNYNSGQIAFNLGGCGSGDLDVHQYVQSNTAGDGCLVYGPILIDNLPGASSNPQCINTLTLHKLDFFPYHWVVCCASNDHGGVRYTWYDKTASGTESAALSDQTKEVACLESTGCATKADLNCDGIVSWDEVNAAIRAWATGGTFAVVSSLTYTWTEINEVVGVWLYGR